MDAVPLKRNILFALIYTDGEYFRVCAIHWETEASILETVTFLWSLEQFEENKTAIYASQRCINDENYGFDFAILEPRQLARNLGCKS